MESSNWGALNQIGTKKKFILREDKTTIGTKGDKKIQNDNFKLEEIIFKLERIEENAYEYKIFVTNLSETRGIYINSEHIEEKNKRIEMGDKDIITVLHKNETGDDSLELKYEMRIAHNGKSKKEQMQEYQRLLQTERKRKFSQLQSSSPSQSTHLNKRIKWSFSQQLECPVCLSILHDPVTMFPCSHNFCGACASQFIKNKQTCSVCDKKVERLFYNQFVNNLVSKFIKAHPQFARSDAEISNLNAKNSIKNGIKILNHRRSCSCSERKSQEASFFGKNSNILQEINGSQIINILNNGEKDLKEMKLEGKENGRQGSQTPFLEKKEKLTIKRYSHSMGKFLKYDKYNKYETPEIAVRHQKGIQHISKQNPDPNIPQSLKNKHWK
jgi:hypothetical protein